MTDTVTGVDEKGRVKGSIRSVLVSVGGFYAHVFRERELLLRSDGHVRFIRIRPRTQFFAALLGATGVGWAAFAGAMLLVEKNMPGFGGSAPALYSQTDAANIGEADGTGGRITDLQAELAEARENARRLSENVQELSETLQRESRGKQVMALSRDALLQRLTELSTALRNAQERGKRLSTEMIATRETAEREADFALQLDDEKTALTRKLTQAEAKLADLQIRHNNAAQRLSMLERRLVGGLSAEEAGANMNTAATEQKIELQEQIARLEASGAEIIRTIRQSRRSASRAESAVANVVEGLSDVVGYAIADAEKTLSENSDRALAMLGEIESLHRSQLEQVALLDEITSGHIRNAEELLSGAGLKIDDMLGDSDSGMSEGIGGPFESAEGDVGELAGSSAELALSVAQLKQKMDRWNDLEGLIACTPLAPPLDYYRVTSRFGMRKDPINGERAMHKGIDMGGWTGMTVYAPAAGRVTFAGPNGSYGNLVEIDHGCGTVTRYGHLRKVLVKEGQEVSYRAKIGLLGTTGRSTGPHIHYEILVNDKPLDPEKFIERGRYVLKK